MSFSIQRAVSDGTMTLLPVSIEYLDREEISVLFDGILNARQWAWVGTTDKTLSFTPPVANTVEVTVVRSTDLSELRHQFSLGAQFTAESLDESLLQVLHIAQEATERQLGGDFFTDINMHGLQITNLGAATAPDHAVTLAQYQADASGASAAKDTAVASASTAVAASNSASASASAALISANNADVSEFNALSSASSASASASTASTKATEAAASAAAALVSENASELAEINAKASEVAASASAASALHPWEAEAGGIHYDLGNIRIGGVGTRITGDFSNAPIANRVMFQTSTAAGTTSVGLIPGAGGTTSQINVENATDVANSAFGQFRADSGGVVLASSQRGTGTYLPMTFYTGGSERMRIATDGSATFNGLTNFVSDINLSTGPNQYFYFDGALHISKNGTGERLQIDANGNVLVTNATGGLGYGIGSGGTVTQATSKATAVTLNKPTGVIITSADALAANTAAIFIMNNSLVAASDCVVVSLRAGDVAGGSYVVGVNAVFTGQAYIYIRNMTAGSRSEALQINFAIIKGATA